MKFLGESESDWAIVELSSDEINGELINDKMYEADRLIEQRLNVKIESEYLANSWDVPDIVRQAVVSGEDEYDVYDMPSDIAGTLIQTATSVTSANSPASATRSGGTRTLATA